MANSPKYSLGVLDDFATLRQICKEFVVSKDNLLSIKIGQDYTIIISEKFNKYDFAFEITNLRQTKELRTYVAVAFAPASEHSNEKGIMGVEYLNVLTHLKHWTSLVERHYKHHPDEVLLNELTELYFEDYKIHDIDADTETFNEKQQLALTYFAEILEEVLIEETNQDETLSDIIKDIRKFKDNLHSVSKNVSMKSYSQIIAEVHLKKPGLLKKIFLKVQDALISYAVEKGMHSIIDLGIRLIMTH